MFLECLNYFTCVQVHGLFHLLGFDHEISEEAEAEMEKEEGLLLESLGWKGKGLIQSAYDAETNVNLQMENSDGNFLSIQKLVLFIEDDFLGCRHSNYYFWSYNMLHIDK